MEWETDGKYEHPGSQKLDVCECLTVEIKTECCFDVAKKGKIKCKFTNNLQKKSLKQKFKAKFVIPIYFVEELGQ